MSIAEFSSLIQDKIYKEWIKSLEKSIIKKTVESMRSSEEVASKTKFVFGPSNLQEIYKVITGKDLSDERARDALASFKEEEIQAAASLKRESNITTIKFPTKFGGMETAIFYPKIGWKTITEKLNHILEYFPEIYAGYATHEEHYLNSALSELKKDPKYLASTGSQQQAMIDEIHRKGKMRHDIGFYFHKGHVIGIATNAAKKFKDDLEKTNKLTSKQKDLLVTVLNQYINKLEKDDLESANIPGNIGLEAYGSYIKDYDSYLVEIQLGITNIGSGSKSSPIIEEFKKLFTSSSAEAQAEVVKILKTSQALQQSLLTSEGSPSFIKLKLEKIANIYEGKNIKNKKYRVPPTKLSSDKITVKKPKRKSKILGTLKSIKNELSKAQAKEILITKNIEDSINLISLQNLINQSLHDQIQKNMGKGERADVLNYRTGRFARSAEVTRLTSSREGAITAFYTYMKNPYATFSEGGQQSRPRSRDPKLLISKSIREIAATKIANRLRAVVV